MKILHPKTVWEEKPYAINMIKECLAIGETSITSANWLPSVPPGLETFNPSLNVTKAIIWTRGGEKDEDYLLKCQIIIGAYKFERTIVIPCR